MLKSSDGDSIIYIGSGGRGDPGIYMFNPQPEPPGKLLELTVKSDVADPGASLRLLNYNGGFMGEPLVEISSSKSTGGSMFLCGPETPGVPLVAMQTGGRAGASIYMFNPQPEPPGRLGIQLNTDATQSSINVQYTPTTRGDGPFTEIRSNPGQRRGSDAWTAFSRR